MVSLWKNVSPKAVLVTCIILKFEIQAEERRQSTHAEKVNTSYIPLEDN
jgi:hypothetical protein